MILLRGAQRKLRELAHGTLDVPRKPVDFAMEEAREIRKRLPSWHPAQHQRFHISAPELLPLSTRGSWFGMKTMAI